MELVSIKKILIDAQKNHYIVGGFNVLNLETLQAIVKAAEIENTPIIVQIWYGDLEHVSSSYIAALAKVAAKEASIPVALQLDHGQSYRQCMACINSGFSSVMIDLSTSSYKENVLYTRKIVNKAHGMNVTVEAELGKILTGQSTIEERDTYLTDPDMACQFVSETGIDALAVSVGTAHGIYLSKPVIDFDLVRKLVKQVPVPIVVHGGSNTPDEDLKKLIKLGVAKLNIGTDLMNAFIKGMKESLASDSSELALRDILDNARDCTYKIAREKLKLLNSLRIDR